MIDKDDTSRFTIRDEDDVTESYYISEAENLRIEKLSTRVTLVAVLIPCLVVIVLAVAYLDIKSRVINTQTTGSIGVQNLSKDLESRFSNLSLKQAKIEEQLANHSQALETATTAVQVNLKKATAELKQSLEDKVDRSALAAMSKKTAASMATLQAEMTELNTAFSKFDDELAAQILLMADGLKKDQGRLLEIETKVQQLDAQQLSKESMDLAMGLERLALQEMIKEKIRNVEKKLADINQRIDGLNRRLNTQATSSIAAPPAVAAPKPTPPAASSPPDAPDRASPIVEQTID